MAEILITLGIIGIVAVITMPTLINNIQDRQNIAKWKREYSLISNAFQQTLQENSEVCQEYTQWGGCGNYNATATFSTVNDDFRETMMKKLSVIDYCGVQGSKVCDNSARSAFQDRIKYKWAGVSNMYSRYKALGSDVSAIKDDPEYGINAYNFGDHAYLLNDGAVIYFGRLWGSPWIVVDVNNFTKGPNEIGRDVFIIKVYSNIKDNEHWMKPAGAEGTPNWNNPESGSSGCSKDIGAKRANTVYDAAGAGCSAKYLLE